MRPILERLGAYLPPLIEVDTTNALIPNTRDEFILPRASIVVIGACLGTGLALLSPGGPGLGSLRLPLLAAALAALLSFAFSVSWPLSLAGAYTRYESLPVRLGYLGLLAVPVWLLRSERSRAWVPAAFVFGTSVASLEAMWQAAGGSARPSRGSVSGRLVAGRRGHGGRPVCLHLSERWARGAGRLLGTRRVRLRAPALGRGVHRGCRWGRRSGLVGNRLRPAGQAQQRSGSQPTSTLAGRASHDRRPPDHRMGRRRNRAGTRSLHQRRLGAGCD